jgi:hypothetical protein
MCGSGANGISICALCTYARGMPRPSSRVEAVIGAAREHHGTRPNRRAVSHARRDAVGIDGDRIHPRSGTQRGAGGARAVAKRRVEPWTVDDRRDHTLAFDEYGIAMAGSERSRPGDAENGVAREIELGECVVTEHARAVRGTADFVVLFEHERVASTGCQAGGGGQARGPRSDDHNIMHSRTFAGFTGFRGRVGRGAPTIREA